MSEFERTITLSAAYDHRNPDPDKNYGIHGVDIRFVLKGPLGATQFLLYTGWFLPHVQAELDSKTPPRSSDYPMPADLGFHSPNPRYDDHKPMPSCDVLDGPCYYDGSSMNAEPVYQRLLREGSDGVWTELEDYYGRLFAQSEPA